MFSNWFVIASFVKFSLTCLGPALDIAERSLFDSILRMASANSFGACVHSLSSIIEDEVPHHTISQFSRVAQFQVVHRYSLQSLGFPPPWPQPAQCRSVHSRECTAPLTFYQSEIIFLRQTCRLSQQNSFLCIRYRPKEQHIIADTFVFCISNKLLLQS